jgi:hypothetical protein
MARDYKNYHYHKSHLLGMDYCMHKVTGEVIFQDGVRYIQQEILLLKELKDNPDISKEKKAEVIKNLHAIKKEFSGEITSDKIEKELKENGRE